jgi:cell division protein FtsB
VRRLIIAVCLVATSAFAQDAQDLERRVRELEQKVKDLAEVQREIDVLSREIESLKSGQKRAAAEANATQYGLGAAASKVYRAEPGVSFGGYGEFVYRNTEGEPAKADVLRAVLYTGYKFSDRALFNSELEVEDASTEAGGNVNVEFAYLDYLLRPSANVRAGLLLVPMGLINEQHEPTAYLAARRPLTEQVILPATWSELGAGVFGDSGRWSYRAYLMTGLNGGKFKGADGLREGRQGGGNVIAEDFAAVVRGDFHPFEGTTFGASIYSGHSGQGTAGSYKGHVGIGELHVDSRFRGATLRALLARGTARDVQHIAESADPIGSSFGGWYVEGGYDVLSLAGPRDWSLTPYLRYERADTQRRAAPGFTRNPENDRRIFTTGLSFRPISQTVIKMDWERVRNAARIRANRFNVSLGYIF